MDTIVIKGAEVFVEGSFQKLDVRCENGLIGGMFAPGTAPEADRCIDGTGMRLVPGFIDVHTHGAVNVDVNAADADGLKRIAAFFASQGTTAWNASVLTDTEETTLKCIGIICGVCEESGYGAQLLGVHLEGPFLSPDYKGAMPEHLLRKGDAGLLGRYAEAAGEYLRYVTVAPELEGMVDLIAAFADRVPIALGHSGATYATTMQAIDAGAVCITHTFNGMRLFHQHEPAIMGAALETDVWCEAICDGRHLHPGTVRMLLKCKGHDKVVAITDSIMATGLPDGNYMLGVNPIIVEDGDARLAVGGTRAGSTLTMHQALLNLMKFTGEPMEKLLPLLTENPAAAMRMADRKGAIKAGMDADLVLLDGDLNVAMTIVGGHIVYSASLERS